MPVLLITGLATSLQLMLLTQNGLSFFPRLLLVGFATYTWKTVLYRVLSQKKGGENGGIALQGVPKKSIHTISTCYKSLLYRTGKNNLKMPNFTFRKMVHVLL